MNAISREDWAVARDKMKKEYCSLPDHYWLYYFSQEPSFGFSSKPAGLVNEARKRSCELKDRDIFEVMNIIDVVEETSFVERKFETSPKVDLSWYQNIVTFSDYQQARPDILCNIMYNGDTGTVLSGKYIISNDGCKRYVCYTNGPLVFNCEERRLESDEF